MQYYTLVDSNQIYDFCFIIFTLYSFKMNLRYHIMKYINYKKIKIENKIQNNLGIREHKYTPNPKLK